VASVCEELADVYAKNGKPDEAQQIMDHGKAALERYDDIHNLEPAD